MIFPVLEIRLVKSCTEATKCHAVAEAMDCSKSLARRRLRLSQASALDHPSARQDFEALGGVVARSSESKASTCVFVQPRMERG